MSSPPPGGLYQTSPVDVPITGTADASGNFSKTLIIRQAYWALGKVVAQSSGSPRWIVTKAGSSIPVDFGIGPNASIGPFMVAPNQSITLQAQGALPNATILAQFTGLQSPDMSVVVDHFYPLSSSQILQPIPLATLAADGNFHSAVNIPIPAGTHSILLASDLDRNLTPLQSFNVTGHQTGIVYLNAVGANAGEVLFPDGPTTGFLFASQDTSLDFTWQIFPAGSPPIYVSGDMDPTVATFSTGAFAAVGLESVSGRINIDSFIEANDLSQGTQLFTSGGSPLITGIPYYNGLLVTSFGSKPAPWEAGYSFLEFETLVNAGATSTIIAAPGGTKVIYLHSLWVWLLSRPANSKLVFRDSAGPTSLAHLPELAGNLGPWNFDFKGIPLAGSTSALQLNNPGAANSDFCIGTVAYSIA